MTNLQKIELRKSEVRTRLLELSEMADQTEETRAEVSTLSNEMKDLEVRHQAAILAGEEEAVETTTDAGEEREIRELIDKAELRNWLHAASTGVRVDGAERELRSALLGDGVGEEYMPLDMLLETRADVSTDVANAIQENQSNIAARVFNRTAGDYMGVERPSVPVGDTSYIALTGGATGDYRSDGVAKDAEAATFTTETVSPVRLTTRYLFGVESTARIRGFEEALRADLRAVLGDKLDKVALQGQAAVANTSPVIEGIVSELPNPSNPGSVAIWTDYRDIYLDAVDGVYAMTAEEVRLLVNADTFKQAHKLQVATSGALLSEQLPAARFRVSANMPATASTIATLLSYKAGAGVRGYVQPVWRGISLIRDPYTNASEGRVALTAVMLTGALMIDSAAYGRHEVKVS